MKISIIGYSGSGKSTLARTLAQTYGLDVLHLDQVQFLPGWEVRSEAEKQRITEKFLDSHTEWVIDGNYSKLLYDRRMEESDVIILLLFSRLSCLKRAWKRSREYKNTNRPDMAEGCPEKFDWEFVQWILWKGRSKSAEDRYRNVMEKYPGKVFVLRSQNRLDAFLRRADDLIAK